MIKTIIIVLMGIAVIIGLYIYLMTPCDYDSPWVRGEEKECECIGKKVVTSSEVILDDGYVTQCVGIKIPKEVEQPNVPQYQTTF